jgi:hypothetical protein
MSAAAGPAAPRKVDPTDTAPSPLPRHDGERRYQATLDSDRTYQRLVLAALLLAVLAGSSFGLLAREAGWLVAALWSATAAGFAARCVSPRAAWQRGAEGARERAGALRLAAALTVVCAALISLRSGAAGLHAVAAALGAAGVFLLASFAVGAGWPLNPALALMRLALLAWALFAWGEGLRDPGNLAPFLAVCAAALALDVFAVRRSYFAATVAVVVLAHVANLTPAREVPRSQLWLQFPAVAAEYALLVLAGLRHVLAQPWRLPNATYRIAPLCVVPRLDRAWDHPVKISVS